MHRRERPLRGYSLVELLVVVAIVGILSLVTVPAFMNYQRSNSFKGSLRQFSTDIRNCRQRAISRNSQVRLELDSTTAYRFYELPNGGSWAALNNFSETGPGTNVKYLDKGTTFSANTLGDSDNNSKNDMVFKPDGTVDIGNSTGTVTLLSPWKNIYQNQFVVTLSTTGKITTAGSHT